MPSLRNIIDRKVMYAYGTSEGVTKAWDTRGRGRHEQEGEHEPGQAVTETPGQGKAFWHQHEGTSGYTNPNDISYNRQAGGCEGPGCDKARRLVSEADVPDMAKIEFTMTSGKGGNHLMYDKNSLKLMLQKALKQLEDADDNPAYTNDSAGISTNHFVTYNFKRKGADNPRI